jgi:2,3-bisphosphoglycerate-independent phosphoglycerate mutase
LIKDVRMANFDLMRRLARREGGKIILLVMDGLGGLPIEAGGQTELEAASTPNLDRLAQEGCTGLSIPVARGIEPGSGPAHLALFGYDPLFYDIGRGVLEAMGIGLEVHPGDVAARGNFCTVDAAGKITDRRAGRIASDKAALAVAAMQDIRLPGVEMTVQAVKEHRFALRLRGEGLDQHVHDTDPQAIGVPPLSAEASADTPEARHTADLLNQFIAQARERLAAHAPANMLTLRGLAGDPALPQFLDVYKLRAACVAVYPMYKGVSRLVGMDVIETDAHDEPADEFRRVADYWDSYDFFFCHIKYTDSRGEDGDFAAKAKVIEQVDAALPALLNLKPDTLIVTGDHSTPARLKSHSWHPVPTLLWTPATHMPDRSTSFGERECMTGGLGHFPATDLMQLALAHAKRLERFGA